MRSRRARTLSLLALLVSASAGCFQEIDSRASSETNGTAPVAALPHTIDLMTPPIGITPGGDGETTDDACEAVSVRALDVLAANCAGCHGGGPGQNLGQPPFNFVLDVAKLLTAVSGTVKDPSTMQPVRFLVPGDPDHSRLYVRMFRREMPPGDIVGLPNNPNRPTVSDVSLVRHWIAHCLGANEAEAPTVLADAGRATDARATEDLSEKADAGGKADVGAQQEAGASAETGRADAGASSDGNAADGDGPRRRLDGGPRAD
jgi:hypothetical protein